MADRNRELVPDNWSLVRERVLTIGLCSEGRYSEHSGVCRRAELPGRSVKVNEAYSSILDFLHRLNYRVFLHNNSIVVNILLPSVSQLVYIC